MQLDKNITKLRKQRGITQEQLAEKIGIEIPSLSNIENGKNYPNSETIEKIAKGLILQLITYHSYDDLKIVFFTKEDKKE